MKKMTKLVTVFLSVLLLAGCNSNEKPLDRASKKMNALDNYGFTMKMDLSAKSSGMEISVPVTASGVYDQKNKTMKMDIAMELFGIKMTTKNYTEYKDGKVYQYTSNPMDETKWNKTEQKDSTEDIIQWTGMISKATKVEKQKSDDKKLDHYKVTVDKEEIQKVLESTTASLKENEKLKLEKDVEMDVYLETDTHYIQLIAMDLSDLLNIEEDNVSLTKFTIEMSFDKYNKAGSVKVPEDVIKNASLETENENI